jgi:FMN phosphatase YigB (HAD superfamily)
VSQSLISDRGVDQPPIATASAAPADRSGAKSPDDFAAWLIDLDGTLYRHSFVRAMMAIELVVWGRSAIRTLRTFRGEQERLRAAELADGSDPFALQIKRTARRLGLADREVADVVDDWMIDRPGKWLRIFRRRGLLRAITQFRSQGGRTALVSDYPAQRKLAALRIAGLFDVVVACGEPAGPHYLKPHPSGYLLAAERLGFAADQCLVIGDRADADGEAARRAGMSFLHVARRWTK